MHTGKQGCRGFACCCRFCSATCAGGLGVWAGGDCAGGLGLCWAAPGVCVGDGLTASFANALLGVGLGTCARVTRELSTVRGRCRPLQLPRWRPLGAGVVMSQEEGMGGRWMN